MNSNKKTAEMENMKVEDFRKRFGEPSDIRSVCFLVNRNMVLLGKKKKGFGEGKYLGIGGKNEKGETIEETAQREVEEEIGVVLLDIIKVAILNFYFLKEGWSKYNQQVHVFLAYSWQGTIKEIEEIEPHWFEVDKIPYGQMWDDAQLWLPHVMRVERFMGNFLYDDENKVVDFDMLKNSL